MPRSPILILTALVACTIFLSPWQRDLYIGDEVRYAQVVREMRASGSLLVPHLSGEPYSHKPPLHFWIIYGLSFLFATGSIWPFVLPSLLAFLLLLLIVRRLGSEMAGEGSADLPVFVFSTFYLAWGLAQTARMDLQFVLLISLAVLFLHRFLRSGERRHLMMAGAATGIAILIKGPMAFVICAVLLVFERFRRRGLPRGPYFMALLIAAAIPLAWLIPAMLSGGTRYAWELLIQQNVGRAFGSWTHSEPPWFYILHAPATFFPWFVVMVLAIFALYRPDPASPRKDHATEGVRFCVSWTLAVLIPFSLISGKLDVYMLPACVPLSIIVAGFVSAGDNGRWSRRAVIGNRVMIGLIGLVGVVLLVASPLIPRSTPEAMLLADPRISGFFAVLIAASLTGLLATVGMPDQPLLRSSVALALVALAPMVYLMAVLIPVANQFGSTAPLVRALARQLARGDEIALFKAPYLWSREMPESLADSRHIGEDELDQAWSRPPKVIAVQSDRAHLLGTRLEEYVRVDRVRIKGKDFDVYRRR